MKNHNEPSTFSGIKAIIFANGLKNVIAGEEGATNTLIVILKVNK